MMRLNAFFKNIRRPDSLDTSSAASIRRRDSSAADDGGGETVTITHLLSKAHNSYHHVSRTSIDKSRFSHRLQVTKINKDSR